MEQETQQSIEEMAQINLAHAEAIRRKREKAGKVSAVVITLAVHAIAILILTLIILPALEVEVPQIQAKTMPPTEGTIETPLVTQTTVRSKPASPSSSAKLITSHSSTASVFVPSQVVTTTLGDIGMGTGMGMGFGGTGFGDGQGGLGGLPGSMKGRCTLQERLKRLREGGGNEQCEQAVQKSLRWLKSTQNSDGSWGAQFKTSMTGLALLAYLGHCETPKSQEYGENVTKAITFLVNEANQRGGKLNAIGGHAWVYEHGIGTYALCEALTFVKELKMDIPGLQDACQKVVTTVLNGQHPSGSWDYDYNKGSERPGDTSILGWHVQCLKAAYHAGFEKKAIEQSVERALKRLEEVQADDGTFGYVNKGSTGERLAGVGALCYQMWGKESHKVARDALRFLNRNAEPVYASAGCNLYAWYYTTLSLFQRGSTYWDKWNKKWRDQLLQNQNEDGTYKQEGSFPGAAAHLSTKAAGRDADIYRVCLITLSLEAYYRFLPGTGGK